MPQCNPGIVGGNAFKLAMFGSNCSGGIAFTKLPERWDASWDNVLRMATGQQWTT
jgi:dimethylsulfone monooxygenase